LGCADGWGDGGDDAVGGGGDAAGEGGDTAGGFRRIGEGNAEFVDDGGVAGVAGGVELADEDRDEVADRDTFFADVLDGLGVGADVGEDPGVEALDRL